MAISTIVCLCENLYKLTINYIKSSCKHFKATSILSVTERKKEQQRHNMNKISKSDTTIQKRKICKLDLPTHAYRNVVLEAQNSKYQNSHKKVKI